MFNIILNFVLKLFLGRSSYKSFTDRTGALLDFMNAYMIGDANEKVSIPELRKAVKSAFDVTSESALNYLMDHLTEKLKGHSQFDYEEEDGKITAFTGVTLKGILAERQNLEKIYKEELEEELD